MTGAAIETHGLGSRPATGGSRRPVLPYGAAP